MDVELLETVGAPTRRGTAIAAAPAAKRKPPPPGSSGELKLQGIWKTFGGTSGVKRDRTLQDIHLTCKPGEFVVMVGPSGCGKSTLLNIAAGMIRPDAGGVLLDDKAVSGPGPDRAMVFQEHGLFPWLTASQNVGFGLKMASVPRSEREDRVREALEMVHLSQFGNKLPHELSGGMRQRVAIARALVMNPKVLLMDEPFAALDAQTRTNLHEQLQEIWLRTHKTILFVTHSVGEAVRLADRIIVLHARPGRIRREVPIELGHPRNFDSPDISSLVRLVRKEIEDEVNRVNSQEGDGSWKPQAADDLAPPHRDVGSGI
jgi:NitT/TauT family transport system ATP-binding protein